MNIEQLKGNRFVTETGEKFYKLPARGKAVLVGMVLFFVVLFGGFAIFSVGNYVGNKVSAIKQAQYERQVNDANARAQKAEAESLRLQGVVDAKNEEISKKDAEIQASNERLAATAASVAERRTSYEKARTATRPVFRGSTQREQSDELDAAARELYPGHN